MSVDNGMELHTGTDLAAIAEQRDDERQQAEAEAAQKLLQEMQNGTEGTGDEIGRASCRERV